jgi:hypothetical protein
MIGQILDEISLKSKQAWRIRDNYACREAA